MLVKSIVEEDFVNYKLPSMFIAFPYCDWKCPHDGGFPESVCQNNEIAKMPNIEVSYDEICERFIENNITKAMVFSGLEVFMSYQNAYTLIETIRNKYKLDIPIVIYTGYYPDEVESQVHELSKFKNIIIKFGRYIPNRPSIYDEILGVTLASDNQYAVKIS